jgi:hypothetical protein
VRPVDCSGDDQGQEPTLAATPFLLEMVVAEGQAKERSRAQPRLGALADGPSAAAAPLPGQLLQAGACAEWLAKAALRVHDLTAEADNLRYGGSEGTGAHEALVGSPLARKVGSSKAGKGLFTQQSQPMSMNCMLGCLTSYT